MSCAKLMISLTRWLMEYIDILSFNLIRPLILLIRNNVGPGSATQSITKLLVRRFGEIYSTCNDADIISVAAMTRWSFRHAGAGWAKRMMFGRTWRRWSAIYAWQRRTPTDAGTSARIIARRTAEWDCVFDEVTFVRELGFLGIVRHMRYFLVSTKYVLLHKICIQKHPFM